MSFWNRHNLRETTGGRWLAHAQGKEAEAALAGIGTDSRSIEPGGVFCALRGERFDGHDYLRQAIDGGARLLVIDREEAAADLPTDRCGVLLVRDTVAALGRLAAAYRKTLPGKVIAVTGSVGKTTTKQLIHACLSAKHTGSASPRSFNNHIGVPLTLLSAKPSDAYVVVEIGTNAPGEVGALGRIAQPDIAVITAVGPSHLDGLGDLDAVLREKASLLSHLREGGVAVVNGDVEGLDAYRRIAPAMVTFGRSDACHLRLTDYRSEPEGASFEVNGRWSFRLSLLGEHNALNALAAIAVSRTMKLTEPVIADALAGAKPPAMRLEVQRLDGGDAPVVLINDAYNASPASMAAALDVLRHSPTNGRRIAILGDMLELGERAPEFHRHLGEVVVEAGIDRVLFIGPLSMYAAEAVARRWDGSRSRIWPAWSDATAAEIAEHVEPGDTVLIKGSRAMGLERLIPAIQDRLSMRLEA